MNKLLHFAKEAVILAFGTVVFIIGGAIAIYLVVIFYLGQF